MAETLHPRLLGTRLDSWRRAWVDAATLRRGTTALVTAAGVLMLLLLLLEVRLVSELAGYPAVVIVFVAMLVVPGLFLHQALLARADDDLVERGVLALALGLAISAPSGLLALWLHLDLQTFIRIHTALAALACGAAALFFQPVQGGSPTRATPRLGGGVVLLGLLLVVALGGILTSPVWAGDRVARDSDEWRYMTYVNSYMNADELDALEPIGLGEAPYPRMATNTWLVVQAAVARAADVSAEEVVLSDLTPLLTVFALGATYALAKGLFRSSSVALLAVALQLGYALVDSSHDWGLGRNLLLRMSEDKMVGTHILFPVGVLLISRFLTDRRPRTYVALALISLALFGLHPQPVLFLAITLAALVTLRAIMAKSTGPLRRGALLAIPLAAFSVGQLFMWHLLNEDWPALFRTELVWRESMRIVRLPGDMIMGNYHLILHPIMLGALLLAPVAWLRARRAIPNQVLFAATVGWLPWFFVPPLATVSAKVASAAFVARLPTVAPVAVVLGYLLHEGLRALWRTPMLNRTPAATRVLSLVAPTFALVLVLGGGLLVQETYFRADGGAFYNWTSSATILPGTERSIFLGGKDRLLSGEWRKSDHEEQLFQYLRTQVPSGSLVLAPEDISLHMPGVLTEVKPVYSSGVVGLWTRPPFVDDFYQGRLGGQALEDALKGHGVDYVIVKEVSEASSVLGGLAAVQWLVEIGPYAVYGLR